MKLYHIDRNGTINAGQTLELQKNIYFGDKRKDQCLNMIMSSYNNQLSHHGLSYLLTNPLASNNIIPLSNVKDIIFEYERLLNYQDKLSRYQAFFAFDKKGVKNFIEKNNLSETYFKIYEVESDYVEKHNMSLISGSAHYDIAAMAKVYWENGDDPYERPIMNEYLLKYPIKIVREVKIEELE